ncbi:MAG: solute carrier family 23 protein [Candidatus Competibacteraceae bacterium]
MTTASATPQPSKPADLLYGLTDYPPWWATLVLGLQHMGVIAILLILPVVVVEAAGGTISEATRLVSISMLAAAVGTIAQAQTRGPFGSGYLCPALSSPAYLGVSIAAVKSGGLPLLCGMTLLAGTAEAFFSRLLRHLRILFPPEITGLLIAMVGISIVDVAVGKFMGYQLAPEQRVTSLCVAVVTLAAMIGFNVWSKGRLRLFCVLIGLAVGYLTATVLGVLDADAWRQVAQSDWFYFPLADHPGWSFDGALLIPFLLAMLSSAVKSVGDLTTCQKINSVDWKRPDMVGAARGVLASSLGTLCAGLLGGVGQSTSSSNVGLSIATRLPAGSSPMLPAAFCCCLPFCPKLAIIFAIMPDPIMGATLLFVLAFMVAAGIQIIASRMLDGRKTFVVGFPCWSDWASLWYRKRLRPCHSGCNRCSRPPCPRPSFWP